MGKPCSLPAHLPRASTEILCNHSQPSQMAQREKSQIPLLPSSHSTPQPWSAKSDSEQVFVVQRSGKSNQAVRADNFSIGSGSKPAQGRPSPGTNRSLPPSCLPTTATVILTNTDVAAPSPCRASLSVIQWDKSSSLLAQWLLLELVHAQGYKLNPSCGNAVYTWFYISISEPSH